MADNIKALRENAEQEEMDITEVPEEQTEAFDMKKATADFEWMITAEGDKLDVITIRKRKIPLRLVLSDVAALSREVGNISEMESKLKDNFLSADHIQNVIKTIRILGNSGLRAMEKDADLTDEWIGDHLRLKDITAELILHLMLAALGGMEMETEEGEDDDKEHDVVLEDLRKKKAAGN